jgi:hypothetical protein
MSDWLVLAVPIVLLAIATLLVFTGCQVVFPLDEDEPTENVDTTHGTGPADFIGIDVEIAGTCTETANQIIISLTTNVNNEHFSVTLTNLSSPISTTDLKIMLDDEGEVYCVIEITPAEGEAPDPLESTHYKVKGEEVEPFTLDCENGFELS